MKIQFLLTLYHRAPNANGTDSEREWIGFRTQTDWTPDANGTDCGRERHKHAAICLQYNRESS